MQKWTDKADDAPIPSTVVFPLQTLLFPIKEHIKMFYCTHIMAAKTQIVFKLSSISLRA